MSSASSASVSLDEVSRFSAQAAAWWDRDGPFRALHDLGPLRLGYILKQIEACTGRKTEEADSLKRLRILDVGCGGGLMTEPLARRGAEVWGIDASAEAIAVARAHAAESGLSIHYQNGTAEALAQTSERFDVILALEIVEHVADLGSFWAALANLLKPGGLVVVATLNRTKRSFLLGVVAAEYLLGWVPPGTHDWSKFLRPVELADLWQGLEIEAVDVSGIAFHPLRRRFEICKNRTAVNYFMTGIKKKKPK